jgi:hypothetical protein
VAHVVYNRGKYRILSRTASGTMKALLAQPAYTPNPDHNFASEVTNELGTGGGGTYVRKTLTTVAYVEDDAADRAIWTSDQVSWLGLVSNPAAQTVGWMVIYEDLGGADTANPLIVALDVTDFTTNGDDLVVQPSSAGWMIAA